MTFGAGDTEVDLLEDDVISDIELTTGYEGLKKGVEYTDVPSELRSKVIELQNNVLGENNKFKQNFNEVVRSLLGKNLNILNKEDYDVLNNWFRETKKGTIWQQIWGKKGPTELAKRHHWLFPKTINRELMRDDIELMEEKGFYVAKGGKWLEGRLMRPTQNIDIIQRWIARTMDSASQKSDEYIQLLKEKLLFVNSIPEGEVLRQIAVREREIRHFDNIEHMTTKERIESQEYYDRYKDIMENHNDKLNKKYTVELDGERKEYTGRELIDRIDKEYTSFFEEMHGFILVKKIGYKIRK